MQELAEASGLTAELVQQWFATKKSLPRVEQSAAAVAPGTASEPQTTGVCGSSPPEPQQGGGKEEKMEQSVCGVTNEEAAAGSDETVNSAQGTPAFLLHLSDAHLPFLYLNYVF